ncbi:unnamed protein product [Closterium sp. NIES-64]|nr:unnamed protein product [Closterium sp. NIES-64]
MATLACPKATVAFAARTNAASRPAASAAVSAAPVSSRSARLAGSLSASAAAAAAACSSKELFSTPVAHSREHHGAIRAISRGAVRVDASVARRKVLIVNTNGGGHAVIGFALARQLATAGHSVTIMTVGDRNSDKMKKLPFSRFSVSCLLGYTLVILPSRHSSQAFRHSAKEMRTIFHACDSLTPATCLSLSPLPLLFPVLPPLPNCPFFPLPYPSSSTLSTCPPSHPFLSPPASSSVLSPASSPCFPPLPPRAFPRFLPVLSPASSPCFPPLPPRAFPRFLPVLSPASSPCFPPLPPRAFPRFLPVLSPASSPCFPPLPPRAFPRFLPVLSPASSPCFPPLPPRAFPRFLPVLSPASSPCFPPLPPRAFPRFLPELRAEGVRTEWGDPARLSAVFGATGGFDVVLDNNGKDLDTVKPVADWASAAGVRQFLFISSAGIYTPSSEPPHVEGDAVKESSGHAQVEKYLAGKAWGDGWAAFRPQYITGSGNNKDCEEWFFDRIVRGRPVPIPSPGIQLTVVAHVDDIARMIALAIDYPQDAKGQIFNAVGGRAVTFDGLARMCANAAGRASSLKIVHYDPKAAGVDAKKAFPFRNMHFYSEPRNARERLGFKSFTDLQTVLNQRYIDYVAAGRDKKDAKFEVDDKILASAK